MQSLYKRYIQIFYTEQPKRAQKSLKVISSCDIHLHNLLLIICIINVSVLQIFPILPELYMLGNSYPIRLSPRSYSLKTIAVKKLLMYSSIFEKADKCKKKTRYTAPVQNTTL